MLYLTDFKAYWVSVCIYFFPQKYDEMKNNNTAWLKNMGTDSLFAQIGDSNDKCSFSLEVECWNEDEAHAAQQSPTPF